MAEFESKLPVSGVKNHVFEACHHVVKALRASDNNLDANLRKLLSDLDSHLSTFGMVDTIVEDTGFSEIKERFEEAQKRILSWETKHSMILEAGLSEADQFFQALYKVQTVIMGFNALPIKTKQKEKDVYNQATVALDIAMLRLEKELCDVLYQHKQHVKPEYLAVSSRGKDIVYDESFVSLDDEVVVEASSPEDDEQILEFQNADLVDPLVVPHIKAIANAMFACEYDQAFREVFISVRREALGEYMVTLDIERLSCGDVLKMEWEDLNGAMRKWTKVFKIITRVYLASEKQLCEQILGDFESISTTCFIEISKDTILSLLNFGEAVALRSCKPEMLERFLSMYEVSAEILLDVDNLFPDETGSFLRMAFHELSRKLAERTTTTFLKFKDAIASHESSRAFPGGQIHHLTRNLKGMRLQLKCISSLLNCSQSSAPHIVGLWGMAGIGKTTITREIFRTQAERYDVCYFLPDFHLMCQTKGLSHLRDEFISKIFGEEKVFMDACDTKLSFLRDRFLDKRVLIVLDGVSNARDAEVLVGGFGWFSGRHTVILTSRNRQVLVQCNAKEIYEIPKLSKSESLCLCCQFATEQNWKGRMSLISELMNYASGNPLALRVLGSSIQEQCINDEKQHLRRLRQHPPIKIQDAFRRSFDRRDDDEKNIFLDLACFFRGENKDRVVNILDGCGFFTDLGIYGLIDESLISLVDNRIEMPNIFQDMGRFVVCQEYEDPGKRSRLWDSDDIADVLINNSGTEAIEGIFLDASGLTFELSPTVFERMYRLRLLKLHCPNSENHCKFCLPQGLYSLPDELRLLHWERYPLGSLPRNFNPKNLVELNMPYSNMTKLWKGTKNPEKLKRIILSHSLQLIKFPRLSKAINLEHIDLEGCRSLVKVNSSILHHHKLTFLSLKDCSHLRIIPTTVHLESLEVLNLSGCSELENLQDFSPNLKELYLAGTAIKEMPSSIGDLTRLVTLDLENCKRLQHLPPGISNLKAMMTLKLSGCSNLKSLPILDALFLRDSQRLDTKMTMEEFVPFKLHSAIQESRLDSSEILLNSDNLQLRSDIYGSSFSRDVVEEFLPGFEYLSQELWRRVTIIPFPSSILHSLASRLYALVFLFLYNAYLVDIPEELCCLASVMTLDLGGNSFSQIPKAIKELRKLHSLRLRHCKNLRSLPELPRSLEILNAHGCVSLESFPSGFEQFPRHYIFSNCFNLSPEVVREFIRKVQYSFEGMAKGNQQEHNNAPSFSICMPASAGRRSSVSYQAGSSVRIELTPSIIKTVSGFALSVVVEFGDNYRNAAGFGIKCICRKSRTDLSPTLERIFQFWAPKEAPTVQKDHMFLFGYVTMNPAEGDDHDVLADLVTFEFHPVDWQNRLLDDSCTVKRCGVYLITAPTCDVTHSVKRPSSMDPGELSSVEHMGPPYKRCRLKRVIETVILSLRKRKREKSVSRTTNRSKAQLGSVSPWGNDRSFWGLPPGNVFPQRPGQPECSYYMKTGDCKFGNVCKFHHPIDREAPVPPRQERHMCSYDRQGNCVLGCLDRRSRLLTRLYRRMKASSESSESLFPNMLEQSPLLPSDKLVEKSTKKPRKLSVSELRQATSSKDAIASEQKKE